MTDALDRLKKRNRPTVPNRDASLTSMPAMTQPSISPDISMSGYPEAKISKSNDVQISPFNDVQISPFTESEHPLKTKQTTLRLEQGMSDRLQALSREHGICREVLIEALFEYSEGQADVLQQVLSVAKSKNEQRQHIANLKRAKSMIERFGSPG
jgi:predicted DNA-binding protein